MESIYWMVLLLVHISVIKTELYIEHRNGTVMTAHQGEHIWIVYSVIHEDQIEVYPTVQDERVASIYNLQTIDQHNVSTTYNLSIEAKLLGKTSLNFLASNASNLAEIVVQSISITVIRPAKDSFLTKIYSGVLAALIFINTFIMGLQLNPQMLLAIAKKPVAPTIGFICQYVCMPLIASGWGLVLLQGHPNLMLGLFTVGCCPGGSLSNILTILLDGNINLSIAMTFVSTVAALGMMPLWLFTLGQVFMRQTNIDSTIQIPFLNIIGSLCLLITPVFLGILVKHYKPSFADLSKRVVKSSSLLILLILIPSGVYINVYLFSLMTWKTIQIQILAGMLLPYTGFILALISSTIFRQTATDRTTISIETGIQNYPIAVVLLNFSLPAPDNDLTLVMPFCVLILTPLPLLIILLCKVLWTKCIQKKNLKEAMVVVDVDDKNDIAQPLTLPNELHE